MIHTSYPEYKLINVRVKIKRLVENTELEIDEEVTETVDVDVYPGYDDEEVKNAIWEQHGYRKSEFDLE